MRYIENFELREWVKDSLKKTIFQKAHALSIQTGCNILVKLQDISAPTTDQYYATGPLQKAYNNHQFRKQPGEKFVSGETGLPLMDQAVQSDATTDEMGGDMPRLSAAELSAADAEDTGGMPQLGAEGDMSEMPQIGDLLTEQSFVDHQNESTLTQETAVPMHLSTATDNTLHTTTSSSMTTVTQTSQFDPSDSNGAPIDDVQVKVEPSDVIDIDTGQDAEPKMEETEADFIMSQQQQMFSQPPVPTRVHIPHTSHYQVPISPKPYQCGVCQKAFRSVQVLQKHTQTFHSRPQMKLTPRRGGRGRGSHYLNRPLHQQAPPRTSTYPVFPGAGGDPTMQQTPPKQMFQEMQDLPGTSSQQIAQMAQMASFVQAQSTPVAVTPSTSDFTQSPSMFQSPAPGPSTSSTPAQQGQSTGRPGYQQITRSYFNPRHNPAKPPSGLSTREIQQQILKSPGPVVTNRSFMNNAPKNNALRKVNHTEYMHAVSTMPDYGEIHEMKVAGVSGKSTVFVKKPPNELTKCDLCPIMKYQERYYRPFPMAIGPGTRRQLISLGLVTEAQVKGLHKK